jgi:hypothetical protein
VGIHEGDIRFAGGGLDDDWEEFGFALGFVELLVKIGLGNAETFLDLREAFFQELGIVAQQQDAE